jgi:hypothetical protein
VKNAILNDIDEFVAVRRAAGPTLYGAWLEEMVAKFDGWRRRLAKPVQ